MADGAPRVERDGDVVRITMVRAARRNALSREHLTQLLAAVTEAVGRIDSAETLVVVKGVVAQRWSTERDLSDTLEGYGVETVLASAETADRADRVEDELFHFERIVAADEALRGALGDQSVPAPPVT